MIDHATPRTTQMAIRKSSERTRRKRRAYAVEWEKKKRKK